MSEQVLEPSARIITARDTVPPTHIEDERVVGSSHTRKRLLTASAVVVGIGVAAWYGYSWWTAGRFIITTNDAFVGGNVTVIAPRVAGFIKSLEVADNQVVHSGQLLLTLDDRDYGAALARAEANLSGADAAILNLDATRKLQQAVIEESKADLLSSDAEVIRAQYDVQRYTKLSNDQYASQQQFQQSDAAYREAVAANDKARAAVDAATAQLGVIESQKRQAQATLAVAAADLASAQLNFSYTELRAPIDGVIGNRSAQTGSYATPGAALISLVPTQGLWVDANFKEDQLARMHPGLPVSISADVLPGRVFHGYVASMAPATGAQFSVLPAENATGNFTKIVQRVPVRVALDGTESSFGILRPGLSVTANVDERSDTPLADRSLLPVLSRNIALLRDKLSMLLDFSRYGVKQ